jgi:hypothetical protein
MNTMCPLSVYLLRVRVWHPLGIETQQLQNTIGKEPWLYWEHPVFFILLVTIYTFILNLFNGHLLLCYIAWSSMRSGSKIVLLSSVFLALCLTLKQMSSFKNYWVNEWANEWGRGSWADDLVHELSLKRTNKNLLEEQVQRSFLATGMTGTYGNGAHSAIPWTSWSKMWQELARTWRWRSSHGQPCAGA